LHESKISEANLNELRELGRIKRKEDVVIQRGLNGYPVYQYLQSGAFCDGPLEQAAELLLTLFKTCYLCPDLVAITYTIDTDPPPDDFSVQAI
jgi:hypothetical protein